MKGPIKNLTGPHKEGNRVQNLVGEAVQVHLVHTVPNFRNVIMKRCHHGSQGAKSCVEYIQKGLVVLRPCEERAESMGTSCFPPVDSAVKLAPDLGQGGERETWTDSQPLSNWGKTTLRTEDTLRETCQDL